MIIKDNKSNPEDLFQYETFTFTEWKTLRDFLFKFNEKPSIRNYCYRGQSDANWTLKPSVERLYSDSADNFTKEWNKITEKNILNNYKKAFHLFSENEFDHRITNSEIDWLSLMQHHGAATRLLDVSVSPFIACFFALSDVFSNSDSACIWIIPLDVIDNLNISILSIKTSDRFKYLYDEYQKLKLGTARGKNIIGYSFLEMPSKRPFLQKGGFLYSMASKKSFSELLHLYSNKNNITIKKVIFEKKNKHEIKLALMDLINMNISFSTLFPGLDGYTKDLLLREYVTIG
ncbi:FRG domain-containing protein [Leptospira meyeri]|uniref:FRG domain-containing protein n=1 Tax=Leptospira meyeri TaxID=29508 RepID=UPI000C2963A3|nr:FRG domain-containing protein [Leptospira meyeri]